ncbi:MAG: hypothetical protein AB1450_11905 [Pseudomonadota bacterium]
MEREFNLRDGERVKKIGAFKLVNGKEVECAGPVLSYLEFNERLIVLLNWYHASNLYDIYRNIFCYAKSDGHLIWQIEQPFHSETGALLEEVFKNIKLYIRQNDGSYKRFGDQNKYPWDDVVAGSSYPKPFRPGIDRLETMTWSQFPQEYYVDYETGKLTWFAKHQKI